MGAGGSKNVTDLTTIVMNRTDINNSVKNNIQQNCVSTQDATNVANIIGSKVRKLSTNQQNSIRNLCVLQTMLDSSVDTQTQTALLDKIRENLKSQGGILGGNSENISVSKSISKNESFIDNSKFNQVTKDCILNISAKNIINIIGSDVQDSNIDQVNQTFLQCMSQHSDTTKISASDIKQASKDVDITSESKAGDLGESFSKVISSLLSPLTGGMQAVTSIVIGIIVLVLLSSFSSSAMSIFGSIGGGGGGAPQGGIPMYLPQMYQSPYYE